MTFEMVERLAAKKGLHIEKDGTGFKVWDDATPGTTELCENIKDAYDVVYHHEKGKPF